MSVAAKEGCSPLRFVTAFSESEESLIPGRLERRSARVTQWRSGLEDLMGFGKRVDKLCMVRLDLRLRIVIEARSTSVKPSLTYR